MTWDTPLNGFEAGGHIQSGCWGQVWGGAVAILYSQNDPGIRALVTTAAVADPMRIAQEIEALKAHMVRWKEEGYQLGAEGSIGSVFFEDARRQDVIAAVRRIKVPLLILHGDRDEVVPVQEAHDLFYNAGGVKELKIIAGGDHRFTRPGDLESVIASTKGWFKKHMYP